MHYILVALERIELSFPVCRTGTLTVKLKGYITILEQERRVERPSEDWKSPVLPLNYSCKSKSLEQVVGIEPTSYPWQGQILTVELHLLLYLGAGSRS